LIDFSHRVKRLEVHADDQPSGQLLRESQYRFAYSAFARRPVALTMPVEDREFTDTALFAAMDMNLPEGFLLRQIYERSPKQPPTEMHLLALMGANGIGRLVYLRPEAGVTPAPAGLDRTRLLREGAGRDGQTFLQLVEAYLATGSGLSGVQPKIVVPERATFPIPNLIVKCSGDDYPGLSANEFLCLEVAQRIGLSVPRHGLSDDGALLVIDRFDLVEDGTRLGFEDVAALMDLRVGGALSNRKYRGSYEDVFAAISLFAHDKAATAREFFAYVALTVLLRNGDGHLKNFGVLYDDTRVWLAPVYDVVTTTVYPYDRAGVAVTDRTMALKLRKGRHTRAYPLRDELLAFGREVCGVQAPEQVIEAVCSAMSEVMHQHRSDERIAPQLRDELFSEWAGSMDWNVEPSQPRMGEAR
jgi:serine/threonine-protein kinase HipA